MKKEHKKTTGLKKKASQYLDFKHVKLTNEVFALVEFPLWLHLCFQFSLLWFGVQHGWNLLSGYHADIPITIKAEAIP